MLRKWIHILTWNTWNIQITLSRYNVTIKFLYWPIFFMRYNPSVETWFTNQMQHWTVINWDLSILSNFKKIWGVFLKTLLKQYIHDFGEVRYFSKQQGVFINVGARIHACMHFLALTVWVMAVTQKSIKFGFYQIKLPSFS